ncbi:MAG: N-acyl-D-amino-acid deacylase [Actinomycetota bacterium]|jgi:N-acyl-D-aspartate/D-glutamate deacylase|nr:N-acyl-D-amino-acid deacylase [Actinomycetota bacterium]
MTAFDLLLRGGTVIDGTGAAGRGADVAVMGDRVAAIGDLSAATAARVVDATGLIVAPGFIDAHSHADVAVFCPDDSSMSLAAAPLLQGVTTEVCGNCGMSPFPVLPTTSEATAELMCSILGDFSRVYDDLAAYRDDLSAAKPPTNLAPLIGHNTLRASVVGMADRPATEDELMAMERLVEQAMDQGAFGLSTGLIYSPSMFADTNELSRLAAVAGRYGRPYTTHMRSETDRVDIALAEVFEIARRGNVAVHVSHHKVAGRRNFGRSGQTLAMIDEQLRAGLDVTLDAYPYTAGSTMLFAALPPWVNAETIADRLELVKDATARERMRADLRAGLPGWENLMEASGWSGAVIVGAPSHPEVEGRSIAEIADGRDEVDTVCELLERDNGRVGMVVHMMEQADVDVILSSPASMVGSDGVAVPGKPHPRLTGTFPRVLGRLARDRGVLSLPDAVHRMTQKPALRFGLTDRGVLRVGAIADIAVFDAGSVLDIGTYDDPLRPPAGVRQVVVSGRLSIDGGVETGERVGAVLAAG